MLPPLGANGSLNKRTLRQTFLARWAEAANLERSIRLQRSQYEADRPASFHAELTGLQQACSLPYLALPERYQINGYHLLLTYECRIPDVRGRKESTPKGLDTEPNPEGSSLLRPSHGSWLG